MWLDEVSDLALIDDFPFLSLVSVPMANRVPFQHLPPVPNLPQLNIRQTSARFSFCKADRIQHH
jgi:hypothetical protein